GRGTVGDDVAGLHLITHPNQRPLVDAGVLVRALELCQRIDIDTRLGWIGLFRGTNHNALGIDLIDDAGAPGGDRGPRIARDDGFHTGADQRRIGAYERHRLALHVRTHESAVGIVVLEERYERGGDRNQLLRRYVHEVDAITRDGEHVTVVACCHQLLGEVAIL